MLRYGAFHEAAHRDRLLRDGPRVQIAQAEEQREEEDRHHGSVAKTVSPIPSQHDPHPPCAAYWISTKKSAPRARLRKNRNETSHEKKNCFGFPRPSRAQAPRPARRDDRANHRDAVPRMPGGNRDRSGRSAT
jgi:hypothetical protein